MEILERNIADAGSLLTEQEKRRIRGLRYTWVGRDAYAQGDIRQGLSMLIRAIALGHEPFANLRYLAVASPPARLAKQWLQANKHADGL
jgi:hypothetical protein